MEALKFRMLEKDDIKSALQLMDEIQPTIGGVHFPSLYRTLCQDALSDQRVVFAVAEEHSKLIGFRIAIIDLHRWRWTFAIRHPLLGMRMVFFRTYKRFMKFVKKAAPTKKNQDKLMSDIDQYITHADSNKSWKDSSPQIAKGLYIAVAKGHRGGNIAGKLAEYAGKVLVTRGARRLDGRVLFDNISSIRLNRKLGYEFYKRGGSFFLTKDIS